jgi:hypothetical protein
MNDRAHVWAGAVDAGVHRGLGGRLELALELVAVQVDPDQVVGLDVGVGHPARGDQHGVVVGPDAHVA